MASSSLPSSPPSSFWSPNWKPRNQLVFFTSFISSFYSADFQKSFLRDILKELRSKGIDPFIGDETSWGKPIGPELIQRIRRSRIAIVMLSRNYASSSCLNELVEIIKCREELGQLVAPIFYDLDPSDVKNQTGEFGELFRRTCKDRTKEDIGKWRHALVEVAEIVGYHRSNWDDEVGMIKMIATHISSILNISTASSDINGSFWDADSLEPNFVQDITSDVSTFSSGLEAQPEKMEPMSDLYLDEEIADDISNKLNLFEPSSDIWSLVWETYIRKMDSEKPNTVKEITSDVSNKVNNSAPSSYFNNLVGMGAGLEKMKHIFKGSHYRGKSREQENVLPRLKTSVDRDNACDEDKSIDTHEVYAKADNYSTRFHSPMEKQRMKCVTKYKDLCQKKLLKEYPKVSHMPSISAGLIHYTTPLYTSQRDFEGTFNRLLHSVYIYCANTIHHSFASHLSMDFRRNGIAAFVNSKETMDVMEGASAFVVVLSKNYLSSTSCMDMLLRVLQCRKKNGQLVVPVFYGISPSDVVVPENESREWSTALEELRELPRHHSREECTECELVEEIVKEVYEKLFPSEQTGINSRLLEIEQLICKQPWGIRRIGIWGMPGIGKTTLAKAVFDRISGYYEASCFIKHFERVFHEKGFHRLLEEHFAEILKELPRVCSSITRPSLPRDILSKKRTLVVLDEVHSRVAAKSFLEGFHWFGPGSLMIITSRDKSVFRQCQINHVYEVPSLNENESLQLFYRSAFGQAIKEQNLLKLSKKVIDYAYGNPSALSFFGRELKGKKLSEMETTFLKLKLRTPYKIHDLFKSSYESLDKRQKNIFMDIACFFNGENVDYVMQLLEGCGFSPLLEIDVLVENSLLTISENRIKMHRIIQDFGRETINRETIQVERRRRLWEPCAIKFLLEDDKLEANGYPNATCKRVLGTVLIEGIFLDTSNLLFDAKPTAFKNMLNLRLLKIYNSSYTEGYGLRLPKGLESLPYELRLLHWENYPLQSLPEDFDPCHLVELNMPYSQLQKLWEGFKNLEMLKILRLCHSQQLTEIDDICKAPNVELIDLQGCTKLKSFPAMCKLQHLRVLNLSGCIEIKTFPEVSPNIEELHLQGTGISELPVYIVTSFQQAKLNGELFNLLTQFSGVSDALNLEQLTSLVKGSSSNQHLGKLVCLIMKDCSHLQSLPAMVYLEYLEVLDLSGCSNLRRIEGFPRNLKELYLVGTAVKELPPLPQSLEVLNAHGCLSLRSISFGFKQLPRHCTLSNCFALSDLVLSEYLKSALAHMEGTARDYQQKLNKSLAFSFSVPSPAKRNVPFHLQPGYSVLIRLSPSWRSTLVGFAILVEAAFSEEYHKATAIGFKCVCRWKDKEGRSHRQEKTLHCWTPGEKDAQKFQKDHMFLFCDLTWSMSIGTGKDPDILGDLIVFEIFLFNKQIELLEESCTVKNCGVHVITAANEDTSLTTSQPVLSLDPPKMLCDDEVEELVRGLDEKYRNVFLYIACLLNDEEADLVAPFIASIGLGVSSAIKVLANNHLLCVSTYGVIVPQNLLGKLGREIVRRPSMLPDTLNINQTLPIHSGESVGIKDHVADLSFLSSSKSEKVKMVGTSSLRYPFKSYGSRDLEIAMLDEVTSELRRRETLEGSSDSSSVVPLPRPQHQVFINFGGIHLQNNFVSKLEKALRIHGINVFIDKHGTKGKDPSTLFSRIEESTIALAIFSSLYSESEQCLDELEKIYECVELGKLVVIPIFYKVTMDEVIFRRGAFGLNFEHLTWKCRSEKIDKWRKALEAVPNKMGFTLDETSDEGECIDQIVEEVIEVTTEISIDRGKKIPIKHPYAGGSEAHEAALDSSPLLEIKLDFGSS